MLADISRVGKIFVVCGRTDMRKSIDGLMSIVSHTFQMDPYDSNSLYLFCGRRADRIKALVYDKNGFTLIYQRLETGRFQWPRDQDELRQLSRQEFRWLLEGLAIDQPKAIIQQVKSREL
jgi:transposase